MRCLVIGASGMLGQALMAEAGRRSVDVRGLARNSASLTVDITNDEALNEAVSDAAPDLIVNAAALVDLKACEQNHDAAYRVNARAVSVMSEICRNRGIRFVQISTDHYYTGDASQKHDEQAPAVLTNEYARTKYAGEAFALALPGALVVRTNITGMRRNSDRPTFAEWALRAIEDGETINAFTDYFTSTLDTRSFARALFDLIETSASGVLNLASRDVASKEAFIRALAFHMEREDVDVRPASVRGVSPVRNESTGLEVSRAEQILGYALPGLDEVARALVEDYQGQS